MDKIIKSIKLVPKNIFVPLSVVGFAFVFMAGSMFTVAKSVWTLSSSITEFKSSLNSRFDSLERSVVMFQMEFNAHKTADWTKIHMERWAYLLERENRASSLNVPNPMLVYRGEKQ